MYRRNYLIQTGTLLFCTLLFASTVFSAILTTNVPFANKKLNPNEVIQANYSFGNQPGLLCFDNNLENIGEIKWPYKGSIKSSSLPVLLKVRIEFEGKFADKSGQITITNTSNKQLIITCTF